MFTTAGDHPPLSPVIAGFDGSDHGLRAVRWAAAEADRRARPLLVAWVVPPFWFVGSLATAVAPVPLDPDPVERATEGALSSIVTEVRHAHPGLDVRATVLRDLPVPGLNRLSIDTGAEMLVVGEPGPARLTTRLLGSTVSDLARTAPIPAVVVRAHPSPARARLPVLVGVDGTEADLPAIEFAMAHALEHGAAVRLVHAWSDYRPVPLSVSFGQIADHDWRARFPNVTVQRHVVRANATDALAQHAEDASLLVIGRHPHRPWHRILSGSTGRTLLHSAPCTVAVLGVQSHAATPTPPQRHSPCPDLRDEVTRFPDQRPPRPTEP